MTLLNGKSVCSSTALGSLQASAACITPPRQARQPLSEELAHRAILISVGCHITLRPVVSEHGVPLLEGLVAEAILCVAGGGQFEGLIGQLQQTMDVAGDLELLVCCGGWRAGINPMVVRAQVYAGRHAQAQASDLSVRVGRRHSWRLSVLGRQLAGCPRLAHKGATGQH